MKVDPIRSWTVTRLGPVGIERALLADLGQEHQLRFRIAEKVVIEPRQVVQHDGPHAVRRILTPGAQRDPGGVEPSRAARSVSRQGTWKPVRRPGTDAVRQRDGHRTARATEIADRSVAGPDLDPAVHLRVDEMQREPADYEVLPGLGERVARRRRPSATGLGAQDGQTIGRVVDQRNRRTAATGASDYARLDVARLNSWFSRWPPDERRTSGRSPCRRRR